MSDPYFEVYKSPSDYYKWSKKIEYVGLRDDFSEERKEKVIECLKYLEPAWNVMMGDVLPLITNARRP